MECGSTLNRLLELYLMKGGKKWAVPQSLLSETKRLLLKLYPSGYGRSKLVSK